MSNNAVKHPSHYAEGRKYEPKDVIRDWQLNFNLGSAVKYVARAGRKDDIVQDLKKAQECIQFEIDAIEAERAKEPKHDDKLDAMLYGLRALHTNPLHINYPKDLTERIERSKKLQEMLHNPEPKCTFNPIFAEMENGKGVSVGTLEVTVPAGADPEDIINAVISKIYGGE